MVPKLVRFFPKHKSPEAFIEELFCADDDDERHGAELRP